MPLPAGPTCGQSSCRCWVVESTVVSRLSLQLHICLARTAVMEKLPLLCTNSAVSAYTLQCTPMVPTTMTLRIADWQWCPPWKKNLKDSPSDRLSKPKQLVNFKPRSVIQVPKTLSRSSKAISLSTVLWEQKTSTKQRRFMAQVFQSSKEKQPVRILYLWFPTTWQFLRLYCPRIDMWLSLAIYYSSTRFHSSQP